MQLRSRRLERTQSSHRRDRPYRATSASPTPAEHPRTPVPSSRAAALQHFRDQGPLTLPARLVQSPATPWSVQPEMGPGNTEKDADLEAGSRPLSPITAAPLPLAEPPADGGASGVASNAASNVAQTTGRAARGQSRGQGARGQGGAPGGDHNTGHQLQNFEQLATASARLSATSAQLADSQSSLMRSVEALINQNGDSNQDRAQRQAVLTDTLTRQHEVIMAMADQQQTFMANIAQTNQTILARIAQNPQEPNRTDNSADRTDRTVSLAEGGTESGRRGIPLKFNATDLMKFQFIPPAPTGTGKYWSVGLNALTHLARVKRWLDAANAPFADYVTILASASHPSIVDWMDEQQIWSREIFSAYQAFHDRPPDQCDLCPESDVFPTTPRRLCWTHFSPLFIQQFLGVTIQLHRQYLTYALLKLRQTAGMPTEQYVHRWVRGLRLLTIANADPAVFEPPLLETFPGSLRDTGLIAQISILRASAHYHQLPVGTKLRAELQTIMDHLRLCALGDAQSHRHLSRSADQPTSSDSGDDAGADYPQDGEPEEKDAIAHVHNTEGAGTDYPQDGEPEENGAIAHVHNTTTDREKKTTKGPRTPRVPQKLWAARETCRICTWCGNKAPQTRPHESYRDCPLYKDRKPPMIHCDNIQGQVTQAELNECQLFVMLVSAPGHA